jgi:ABC-type nickel/cobalt efflux system permease component RcnA
MLIALGLGFALGIKHALEADHLVAVTTVVSDERSLLRSSLVGALWGLGHTASLLAAGALVILLRVAVPAGAASLLEFAVALMIVFLGGRVLYFALRRGRRLHAHAHEHGGGTHTHLHFHDERDAHPASRPGHPHAPHAGLRGWRPFAVGMVHGLAGSAALTLLVLTEVVRDGSRALGMAYLLVFGLGSVTGMLLMSALIGLPFLLTAGRFQRFDAPVRLLTGVVGVGFGLFYAWRTATGL